MSTVLWTSIAVLFLLIIVCAHEAAHALVLKRLGFPIVEAGLGFPFKPRYVRQPSRRIPFRLSLSPWLLGAYVEPDPKRQKEIEALPYVDSAWYSGAGVVANFLLGGIMWVLLDVIDSHWTMASIVTAGTAVLWFGRRQVAAYVLPVLGIPTLLGVVYSLVVSVGQPQGPVGLGRLMESSTWYDALIIGYLLTMSLGILNLIPIYPFDGGRIADAAFGHLLGTKAAQRFRAVTGVLMMFLVVYSIGSDIFWLAR
jgi:membrane-associated protease RseP (regulator of RpoE activity)